MLLAFHTNALGKWEIAKLFTWAKEHRFNALEIGPSIPLDERTLRNARQNTGVEICCFTYCRNVLDVDKTTAAAHQQNVLNRVRIAGELGVPLMVTSTGRAQNLPMEASLAPGIEFLGNQVLPLARKCGVKIAIENCPAIGNVAVSPAMWRELFRQLPELGLAYDPSHLVWQMIDPYLPLREFGKKMIHVHAKDTEILRDKLQDTGIEGSGWWRYRIPGWGEINWTRVISDLMEAGYAGAISLEHEDPVWEGTDDKVAHALELGRDFLRRIWEPQP
jgi:sugar phosphate isomerase/epimerase